MTLKSRARYWKDLEQMAGWSYTLNDLARIIGAEPPRNEVSFSSVSTDTRTLNPGDVFFALAGPNFDGNRFVPDAFKKGAAAAVAKTASDVGPCLVVDDPLKALQQFAAHHRARYDIPVLALTGSCGKTSTKEMAAQLLSTRYNVVKTQGNLNNEIGCPLSLLQLDGETDIAVIEMGANHKGEIAGLCAIAHPTESAITMVAPAHLEGFGNIENVAKAKAEIVQALGACKEGFRDGFQGLGAMDKTASLTAAVANGGPRTTPSYPCHPGAKGSSVHTPSAAGTFYVNCDDPWCVRIAESFGGRKVRFGSGGDVALEASRVIGPGEMELRIAPIGMVRLPLPSRAHAQNVLLAVAVGLEHAVDTFEGPLREACAASKRFNVLAIGPLTVIDDTYNANPASMAASLDALAEWPGGGARMAALGEMLELGDAAASLHCEVGTKAGRAGISHLFAKGPHACDTIEAARAASVSHTEAIDDPRDLAQAIQRVARPGDLLLVKGSRGMHMERVIQALKELYS